MSALDILLRLQRDAEALRDGTVVVVEVQHYSGSVAHAAIWSADERRWSVTGSDVPRTMGDFLEWLCGNLVIAAWEVGR